MRISDWSSDVCSSDLLEDRRLVAAQAQPFQPVEYGGDRLFRGAGPVGILDPQQEPAAMMAREQPVEKRGARPADVKKTSGRRRKTGYYLLVRTCSTHRFIP